MPSIVDMFEVMQRLESKALHVNPPSCVKVRNRNASCSRCADACPSGCINLHDNQIDIDSELCMECGACAAACPSNAIRFLRPSDEELDAALEKSLEISGGCAVAVCGRVSAHKMANVDVVAGVPCLSRIDVASLLNVCAQGAQEVLLVDKGCSTCKYKKTVPGTDAVIDEANALLEAWGSSARVRRSQEVPDFAKAVDRQQATGGVSRRGFFTGVKSSMKGFAAETAKVTIENELGIKQDVETLRSMLKVDADGTMPHVQVARHDLVMESLFELGDPVKQGSFETRMWGDVRLDASLCDNCGVCATFCTTGALSKVFELDQAEAAPKKLAVKKKKKMEHMEFRLADCVQCGLCEDVCLKKALVVGKEAEFQRVLEFEPVVFKGEKEKPMRFGFRR